MEEIKSAVIKDPRPLEEKLKDFQHLAGGVPITWKEKNPKDYKRYKQRNQHSSFSCVFQSGAKALEVLTGKVLSASPYFWRKNYPEKGSYLQDVGDIFRNRFTTLEELSPSQYQSEAEMNKIKQLTTTIGIVGYKQPNFKNIDEIAEAIEAYGQCIITVGSNMKEYKKTPVYSGTPVTFYHAICAVDYTLINGIKTLVCEDSTGQDSSPDGLRLITKTFLQNRATGALYFTASKDVTLPQDLVVPVIEAKKQSIMLEIIKLLKEVIERYKNKVAGIFK